MNTATFIGFINNAALLVTLGLIYDTFVLTRHFKRSFSLQTLTGIMFGVMGIAAMLNSWEFMPGLIFDTRSVALSVGSLFFGHFPTLIAVSMTGFFRFYQGGVGTLTGVAVIFSSAAIGLIWRHKRRKALEIISLHELYLLGIVVHIAMLLWMFSLPWSLAIGVLSKISLPVMLIYPVGSVLLGKLMLSRLIRKQEQDVLHTLQQRYATIVKNFPNGVIFLFDRDIRYTFAAGKGFETVGMKPEVCIGRTLYEVFPEDVASIVKPQANTVFEGQTVYYELSYQGRFYANWGVPIINEQGEVTEGLVYALDITDLKQQEMELRKRNTFIQTVLENLPIGIALNTFHEGTATYINRRFEEIYGWPKEELQDISEFFKKIYPDEDYRREIVSRIMEDIQSGDPARMHWEDIMITTKAGCTKIINAVNIPLIEQNTMVSTVMDVTAQKIAEDALRESEARLKRAEIVAKTGNWEIHLATNSMSASEGARRVYGVDKPEFTLADVQQIPLSEYRPLLDEALKGLLEEGKPYEVEFKIQRPKDGQIVDIYSAAEYDAQRQIVFGIIQNITERKQMEEQIQTSLQEKTVLLRELYHRTKNTMQVIASMLMLRAAHTGDQRIIALSHEIETKIHAMALVHQKLYEAQHLSRINMREYLDDLVVFLMSSYTNISQKINYRSEIEPMGVLIDTAIPCGLVVSELLSNALKYAFPDDMTGIIQLQLYRSGPEELSLTVSDNGVGIPDDVNMAAMNSLGIQTIINLVRHQLQGNITWETQQGVTCHIHFHDNLYTERV